MGRFLDEPKQSSGRNLLASKSGSSAVKSGRNLLAEKSKASRSVGVNPFELSSPMGIASAIGRSGLSKDDTLKLSDLPYVTAKGVSGALAGTPELIARHPLGFAAGGIVGAQGERGESGGFLKPESQAGERLGLAVETGAGLIPLEALASKIPQAPRVFGKAFSKLRAADKPAEQLSSKLSSKVGEAVRSRGRPLGEYINQSGERLIKSPEKFRELTESLPKTLQEAILSDPELSRGIFGPGKEFVLKSSNEVMPTLKNLERVRSIFRGGTSSKVFDPKIAEDQLRRAADVGYTRVGKLMREGDDPLRELMAKYTMAKRAEKQLGSTLSSKQGFTKPIGRMFQEGTSSLPRQALERLSEYNPRILETIDEIMKHEKSLGKAKMISNLMRKLGTGAAYTAGGSVVAGPLIRGIGGNTTNVFQGGD